jgi:hypothetical protein
VGLEVEQAITGGLVNSTSISPWRERERDGPRDALRGVIEGRRGHDPASAAGVAFSERLEADR